MNTMYYSLYTGILLSFTALKIVAMEESASWAIIHGNESVFSQELVQYIIIKQYRLVSMEMVTVPGEAEISVAILQQYPGPLWYAASHPATQADLVKRMSESERFDFLLYEVILDTSNSQFVYISLWQRYSNVTNELSFPNGSLEAFNAERLSYEAKGFRLTRLRILPQLNGTEAEFIGIWQKPTLSVRPQEVLFNQPLNVCLQETSAKANRSFIPVQFQVFQVGTEARCNAIYEQIAESQSRIEMDNDLERMSAKMNNSGFIPQEVSHFISADGVPQYVVLWTTAVVDRYPEDQPIWQQQNMPPVNYYRQSDNGFKRNVTELIENKVRNFMIKHDVPAFSLAASRNDELKLALAMGYGDLKAGKEATAESLFRIASVSKTITSVATFKLMELNSKVQLDSLVFGPGSLFGTRYGSNVSDPYLNLITVRHLLQHTVGAWSGHTGRDPVTLAPNVDVDTLIAAVLRDFPLTRPPGEEYQYSNFGYLLLGRIIEVVTEQTYESFVKANVFDPAGVSQIGPAGNSLAEALPGEVLYYMRTSENPYDIGTNFNQSRAYGGFAASSIDLLRYLAHVDGFSGKPNILNQTSIRLMTTPSTVTNGTDVQYACGWVINSGGWKGWWHDGGLPGTAALLIRLDNGISFSLVVNIGSGTLPDLYTDTHLLVYDVIGLIDSWPDVDLFCDDTTCPPEKSASFMVLPWAWVINACIALLCLCCCCW